VGLSKPSPETLRPLVLNEDESRAVWTACGAEPGINADDFWTATDAGRVRLMT